MSDKFKYTAGLNNVGSYQVSGKPFVTASTISDGVEQQIEFPQVTNNITVKLDSENSVTKKFYTHNGQFGSADLSMTLGTNFSLVTWMKVGNFSQTNSFIIYTQYVRLFYKSNNKNLYLWVDTVGTSGVGAADKFVFDLSPMTHVVVTMDHDNETKLYLNGNLMQTTDLSSDNAQINGNNIIYGSTTKDFDLSVLEGAIFTSTLNQAQIDEAYNSGKYFDLKSHSQAASLQNYWTFGDDPSDTFNNNGPSSTVTATINDTVGSDNLSITSADNDDEIVEGSHTFSGGGGELRVHYRSTGSSNVATNHHYWTLDSQNESITMNVKTKEIYLSSDGGDIDYSLHADLTTIPTSSMYQHTGSGVDE
jgi:hypothetical protein